MPIPANKSLYLFFILQHIEWRAQNNVDTILQDFTPPHVIDKYYTGGLFGQDKEGSLIWIEPAGYIDLRGKCQIICCHALSSHQKKVLSSTRLLESAGILPFSCQERRGDDSPGWRQARPTAVGWEGGWGYAVTGQLSDSVRRR